MMIKLKNRSLLGELCVWWEQVQQESQPSLLLQNTIAQFAGLRDKYVAKSMEITMEARLQRSP